MSIIIYNKLHVGWLLLLAALLTAACSGDSEEVSVPGTPGDEDVLELVAYTRELADDQSSPTRAIPRGYSEYPAAGDENVSHIGVYLTTAEMTDIPSMGTFFYTNNKWNSLVSVKPGVTYYIYGFMPSDIGTCTVEKLKDNSNDLDFSNGVTMTLSGMTPVSLQDLCVITAVQDMDSEDEEIDLTTGNFKYVGKVKSEDQPGSSQVKNQVRLMFVHAFAAIRMKMTVDKDYAKLRDIRLKEIRLKSGYQYTHDGKFTFTKRGNVFDWGSAKASMTEEQAKGVVLFSDEDGESLSPVAAKTLQGYWIPISSVKDNLYLVSKYDVYDMKGNLVRKDCVAENKLPPTKLMTSVGSRTNFELTVNPTYLYVLSDPDLDNPTVEIGM